MRRISFVGASDGELSSHVIEHVDFTLRRSEGLACWERIVARHVRLAVRSIV